MSVHRSRRTLLALAAMIAVPLTLGACGTDSPPMGSPTTVVAPALRTIRQAAGHPTALAPEAASADASTAVDPTISMRMAWVHYTISGALPELPGTAPAWVYETPVDVDQVSRLAAALGLDAAPVAVAADAGGGWRVGPDDGSGASLYVAGSSLGEWYYSPASLQGDECIIAVRPVDVPQSTGAGGSDGDSAAAPAPTAAPASVAQDAGAGSSERQPSVTPAVLPVPPGADHEPSDPGVPTTLDPAPCETPAPVDLLSEDEQLAAARALLEGAGLNATTFEFENMVGEWGGNVTAFQQIGGFRSPLPSTFQFGDHGVLQWASGNLGLATPAGEYPLIDAAAAVERLNQQSNWMAAPAGPRTLIDEAGAVVEPVDPAAVSGPAPEPASDSGGAPPAVPAPMPAPAPDEVATLPAPEQPADDSASGGVVEPDPGVPMEVEVTGVKMALTTVWDTDGVVWILPAYTFTNADGDVGIVTAVADEYLETVTVTATEDPNGVVTVDAGTAVAAVASSGSGSAGDTTAPMRPNDGAVATAPAG